jgi:hypothetical protein
MTTPTAAAPTLPDLAKFVDTLTSSVENRKRFNDPNLGYTSFRDLRQTLRNPEDLAAFMTMNKGLVGCRVMAVLAPDNDDFTPEVADLFSSWIKAFGGWQWAEEGYLYKVNCAEFGEDKPAYTWPECRIVLASGVKTSATPTNGKYPVKIQVDGEGFLPDCQVKVFMRDLAGTPVGTYAGELDACSTFRGSRVVVQNTPLDVPGEYRAEIHNFLGNDPQGKPVYQRIGSIGLGHFNVAI